MIGSTKYAARASGYDWSVLFHASTVGWMGGVTGSQFRNFLSSVIARIFFGKMGVAGNKKADAAVGSIYKLIHSRILIHPNLQ